MQRNQSKFEQKMAELRSLIEILRSNALYLATYSLQSVAEISVQNQSQFKYHFIFCSLVLTMLQQNQQSSLKKLKWILINLQVLNKFVEQEYDLYHDSMDTFSVQLSNLDELPSDIKSIQKMYCNMNRNTVFHKNMDYKSVVCNNLRIIGDVYNLMLEQCRLKDPDCILLLDEIEGLLDKCILSVVKYEIKQMAVKVHHYEFEKLKEIVQNSDFK